MSTPNPNDNDGFSSGYDDTTTGYASTMDDIDDDDGFGPSTASGYEDDTLQTDDTDNDPYNEYANDDEDNARYNPGVGERYDANTEGGEDETYDTSSRFNEYSDDAEDNARYNPGAGERYDASAPEAPEGAEAQQPQPGGPQGPAAGTRQYNDYDYDSYYEEDDQSEQIPLNPSVRSYDYFNRDGDFQDEYDSDEDEEANAKESSFYKGREQYEYRKDEAQEEHRVKKVKKRNAMDASTGKKVVAAVCCCCICLITILVLVLVMLVFNTGESSASAGRNRGGPNGGKTNRPTPRPTYPIPPALRPALEGRPDVFQPWIRVTDEPTLSQYPTNVASANPTPNPTGLPTPKPTISPAPTRPVPPTITLDAIADTYIYVDGFFQYEAFGTEQSFLVQNGLSEYYEFADAMGLIQFDLRTLPTRVQMIDYDAQAILRLQHLPVNSKFAGRDPATISVMKLLSTPMRVETLHGGMIDREPSGSIVGENTVTVGLNQDLVLFDVSDLLYPVNFTDPADGGYDQKQLLLMLFNNSTEQGDPAWTELEWQDQAGDRFQSVESGQGPSLTITYVQKAP
eukprot:CAMPEP_0113627772 /NCGR_PEP_ID=MMETSP0017_2-20120614/14387_1 /TAXON_ID=2856 /ORGANISM="Cylindrotheca closterium" /LENGTH=568 /DNA_ID=CAMNT_0000538047 /DNA_START=178 /DNA_END=1884 /DNA_ORIENTATION=- /assembly_acc=CAM_ASM_000147